MTDASVIDQGVVSEERRQGRRHRALLSAQIIFRNGFCAMSGQILNVSDTGALVKPADIAVCPTKFVLQPRFEASHNCEVVWRKGETLGVRFV